MPLVLKRSISTGIHLFLWKTTETLEQLLELAKLSKEEKEKYKTFKNQQRKTEWTATRALLNTIFEKKIVISYHALGKPVAEGIKHISISHTSGYVMVVCSNNAVVGADCEIITNRVLRIKERFMNQKELLSLNQNTKLQQVLLYWCLKEVLFKIAPQNEIDFRNDMSISDFNVKNSDDSITGYVQQTKQNVKAKLGYLKYEDAIITWGYQIH